MTSQGDPDNPMDRVERLLAAGQIGDAERYCRRYLDGSDDDINVLGVLGAILLRQNKVQEAEDILKKVVALAPGFAKPHEDLGILYLARKQPEQSAAFLRRAIELDPDSPGAFLTLANAYAQLGDSEAAEAAHRQYLALSPIARGLAEARQLLDRNQADQAEAMCQELLAREPDNVAILRLLARIASDDGRHVIAEGLLRRIVRIAPDAVRHHRDLARFLVERNRYPEVVTVCDDGMARAGNDAVLQLLKGDALSVLGRTADALDAYERCLEQSPDEPQALIGKAHLLRIRGRHEDAITVYERCIAVRPEIGDAWWSLASMSSFEFSDGQRQQMQNRLDSGELEPGNEAYFRFALARYHERQCEFDAAWQEYLTGNRLKRSTISYDPVEAETQNDNIIDVFSAEFANRRRDIPPGDEVPIFIVGMPRSGSTLLEQVLASHSAVEGTGELPYVLMIANALASSRADDARYPRALLTLSDQQLASVGLSYLYQTRNHRSENTTYFTDKLPGNFCHAGLISVALPQAKIIDARRNPLDTCVANFRQLYAAGKNQTYDLTELAEYYLQYVRMMQHWDDVLPGRVLRVNYEDVVNDLEGQVRTLLAFCGLPFEAACLRFFESMRPVNTASAEQVRRPIYRDAVGFWKNYERHLGELLEILEPVLD